MDDKIEIDIVEITNEQDRMFRGWVSVEVEDTHGEFTPVEELKKVMNIWMKRDAPLLLRHSHFPVGKGLRWNEGERDGKKGIWIDGLIHKDTSVDNETWKLIKTGKAMLSYGGRSWKQEEGKNYGDPRTLKNLEMPEISIVERGANPLANIVAFNPIAKSAGENMQEIQKPDDERPPKAWWDKCVARVSEGNPDYSDEQVSATCGSMYFHEWGIGKSEDYQMEQFKKEEGNFATFKRLKTQKTDKERDSFMAEPAKAETAETKKQETPATPASDPMADITDVLKAIVEKLDSVLKIISPKEEKPEAEEEPEETEMKKEVAGIKKEVGEMKDIMKGLTTSTTPRPDAGSGAPLDLAKSVGAPVDVPDILKDFHDGKVTARNIGEYRRREREAMEKMRSEELARVLA